MLSWGVRNSDAISNRAKINTSKLLRTCVEFFVFIDAITCIGLTQTSAIRGVQVKYDDTYVVVR